MKTIDAGLDDGIEGYMKLKEAAQQREEWRRLTLTRLEDRESEEDYLTVYYSRKFRSNSL